MVLTARWAVLTMHATENKPSDYYKKHVMYLLVYLRDNIFPEYDDASIFSVINFVIVQFKDNYARFYIIVLIIETADDNVQRTISPGQLRCILRRVRSYYLKLPKHLTILKAGGQYHRYQGVLQTCVQFLKNNAIEVFMKAQLGFHKVAYIKEKRICSKKLSEITIPIFYKFRAFRKQLANEKKIRNAGSSKRKGNKRPLDSNYTNAHFNIGEFYNLSWSISAEVILYGIFVILKKWRHCGLDVSYLKKFGGSGILMRSKVPEGSYIHNALQILNHIPCNVFNDWAGTHNIHARDFGIDFCLLKQILQAIHDSIDDTNFVVMYGNINQKNIPPPGHLSGSTNGVLSDPAPWMY